MEQACVDAGTAFADILAATATDVSERQQLVRERAQLIREHAKQCTAGKWSADVIACYRAAKARVDLDACLKLAKVKSG